MLLTPEGELWAEALHIHMTYGVDAGLHIAERIREVGATGDAAGVQRWISIGARVEQLAVPRTLQ